MTDGEGQYRILGPMFAGREGVNHGIGEYARRNNDGSKAHTNTVKSYFATLERDTLMACVTTSDTNIG